MKEKKKVKKSKGDPEWVLRVIIGWSWRTFKVRFGLLSSSESLRIVKILQFLSFANSMQ